MPALRELQRCVMDALLGGSPTSALALIGGSSDEAASRFSVYRNNVQSNFADGLRSSYPAVWRLVGADYFRRVARDFQRQHPSHSGNLVHAGRYFADYLAQLHHADRFAYLPHVARLEWLVQEALLAADHAPLDLVKLARVAPEDHDSLRFDLHPTLRLFDCPYPAVRIRKANVDSDTEPEFIDLDSGGDRIAVIRQRLQLNFHPLSQGEYCLLGALQRGEAFAAAVNAAEAQDDEFDASAALRRCVASQAIVDCR